MRNFTPNKKLQGKQAPKKVKAVGEFLNMIVVLQIITGYAVVPPARKVKWMGGLLVAASQAYAVSFAQKFIILFGPFLGVGGMG